jgi:uncharacterized protein with HEPN domain
MAERRTPRERLLDIDNAILKIRTFLSGRDFAAFSVDGMLHDAIMHNLSVISEACRFLKDDLKQQEPTIPWRNVADMGNWLRHGYDVLDDEILWETVQRDLPPLKSAIERLLESI